MQMMATTMEKVQALTFLSSRKNSLTTIKMAAVVPAKTPEAVRIVMEDEMVEVDLEPMAGAVEIYMGDDFVTVPRRVAPDGGYGWKVAIASFVLTFFVAGILKSGSKFGSHIKADFPDDPTESGLVFFLPSTLALLISPLTATVLAKFGPATTVRSGLAVLACGLLLTSFATSVGYLMVSVGVCLGIGSSLVGVCTVSTTGKYFTTMKSRAIAVVQYGGNAGGIALPYAFGALLSEVGMQHGCIIFGLLFALLSPLSGFYGPPEEHFVWEEVEVAMSPEVPRDDAPEAPMSLMKRLKEFFEVRCGCKFLFQLEFLVLLIALFFAQLGISFYKGSLSGAAKAMGIAPEQTAQLSLFGAVGELVVRALYGFRRGPPRLCRLREAILLLAVTSLAVVLMAFSETYWHLVCLSVVAAVAVSCLGICIPLLLAELHGAAQSSSAGAAVKLGQGVANLLSRGITSAVSSQYGSFAALGFCGGYLVVGTVTALFLHLYKRSKK